MAKRQKSTRGIKGKGLDLIDEHLASDEETTDEPVKQHAGLPTSPQDVTPLKQHNSKPSKRFTRLPAKQQTDIKEKGTFYFTPGQLNNLDDVKTGLKRIVGKEYRNERIDKSFIMRLVLDAVINDFQSQNNPKDSLLVKWLTGKPA